MPGVSPISIEIAGLVAAFVGQTSSQTIVILSSVYYGVLYERHIDKERSTWLQS
jgi:hypothetical protein